MAAVIDRENELHNSGYLAQSDKEFLQTKENNEKYVDGGDRDPGRESERLSGRSLTNWRNPPNLLTLKQDLMDARPTADSQKSKVALWLDNLHVRGKAKVTEKKGIEVTVRLENGELRAITQEADEEFRPGERVRLLSSGGTTRVTH